MAEVYRAGINSVHQSQVAAARSLGLSQWKSLRFVVLPQAVRTVIPPLLNDFISLQKDTALVSTLGAVIEANRAAQIDSSTLFVYSSYTVAALLFLCLTIPLARFTDRLIARDVGRRHGGGRCDQMSRDAVVGHRPAGDLRAQSGLSFGEPAARLTSRGGPARGRAQVVRRLSRCCAGSTCPSRPTRSSASSGRRVRASRRCFVA